MSPKLLYLALPLSVGCAKVAEQPNVLFILVDDLGYSDVGYMGEKSLPTPNIDKLSQSSINFTNAYAAAPVSSPTRGTVLTGLSPAELKITCHIPGVGMELYTTRLNKGHDLGEAYFTDHVDTELQTVAKMMKGRGYNTGFIGKWHLAGEGSVHAKDGVINEQWHPEHYGYDVNIGGCSYGQPASYFSPYRNATITDGEDGEYLTDRVGDEAIKYLRENQPSVTGKPFFLNLSFYTVHTPYQVPQETLDANGGDKYVSMIDKLDQNVGRVLDALHELGLAENTVVIFTSDNGGLNENPPLSGKKGDILEGGIKVPLLVSWPKVIKESKVNSTPTYTMDFYHTLSDVASMGENPDIVSEDSRSLYPIMVNGDDSSFDGRTMYWHFPHRRSGTPWIMASAVQRDRWKLIYMFERDEYLLFNLEDDPKELNNLATTQPEKVEELKSELESWWERVDAEMPTKLN
ncbi:MAG: sulfatase [Rikenellaceae bacterium]